MALPVSQVRPIAQAPAPLETALIYVATVAASMASGLGAIALLRGSPYLVLASWASHLAMLAIPLLWYQLRVAPALPPERRPLFRWRSAGTRLFLTMAPWFLVFKLAVSIPEVLQGPAPKSVSAGAGPLLLTLLFQGLWVGLTEELAMRPALHLPLSLRLTGKVRVWRWELSHALLWTALAFGLIHLPNVFLGQSLPATLVQAFSAAVIGLFFGYYYERTDNYLGAAMLHNVLDVVGYLLWLVVLAF